MRKEDKMIREETIEKNLVSHFLSYGEVSVKNQVKLSMKRIDVVMLCHENGHTVAIEIKVRDWKSGLRQAAVNVIACHKSYVAVWYKYANTARKNASSFEALGVGLMIINSDFKPEIIVSVENGHSKSINMDAHKEILRTLNS